MKLTLFNRSRFVVFFIAIQLFLFNSCDKTENLFLSDSEKLMKDLKGTYNLVSVRHEELGSNDGGGTYYPSVDTTYSATGLLDISNIDKADYTGTLTIQYAGFNETHSINGSAAGLGDYDNLWVITDGGESITCLILFNPPASYLEGWLDEHDDNHILLRFSETSVDYSSHKNRFFRFEKE
jgi:hypothetical protein